MLALLGPWLALRRLPHYLPVLCPHAYLRLLLAGCDSSLTRRRCEWPLGLSRMAGPSRGLAADAKKPDEKRTDPPVGSAPLENVVNGISYSGDSAPLRAPPLQAPVAKKREAKAKARGGGTAGDALPNHRSSGDGGGGEGEGAGCGAVGDAVPHHRSSGGGSGDDGGGASPCSGGGGGDDSAGRAAAGGAEAGAPPCSDSDGDGSDASGGGCQDDGGERDGAAAGGRPSSGSGSGDDACEGGGDDGDSARRAAACGAEARPCAGSDGDGRDDSGGGGGSQGSIQPGGAPDEMVFPRLKRTIVLPVKQCFMMIIPESGDTTPHRQVPHVAHKKSRMGCFGMFFGGRGLLECSRLRMVVAGA